MQHDLRAHPQPVLGLVAEGHLLQSLALGGAQGYRAGGGNGQGRQAYPEKWITTDRSLPYPATGPSGRMSAMPTPSEHTRLSLAARLGEHARSWIGTDRSEPSRTPSAPLSRWASPTVTWPRSGAG
ncbi:hypothetical protein ACIHEI_29855 [Kitasatospora sp. NPDC051984]|uniref:hypothetical protein n=1 Tax=Kitasatospora sp. NPDC051984 TaxID=3364059 RepID=UPI0037C688C4